MNLEDYGLWVFINGKRNTALVQLEVLALQDLKTHEAQQILLYKHGKLIPQDKWPPRMKTVWDSYTWITGETQEYLPNLLRRK